MYDDSNVTYKVGINWKDIIIKIILLVLFILLLMWLFPQPDLDVFYDSIYTNNINNMRDAAEKYYTTDRLPSTVGESTSMTLKEMVDNKMIIRFTDKDKNYCDETESMVQVTKTADNEYVLKVQLNCGDQKDYILETIGCNDVCTGSNCTTDDTIASNGTNNSNSSSNSSNLNSANGSNNGTSNSITNTSNDETADMYTDVKDADLGIQKTTILYYQHKKAIYSRKTVYTCPSGYTLNGTKCTKETTGATIDATPVYGADKTLITDAKYNNSGEYKEYADVIKTKTGTDYTCPEGYTENGAYCIKYTDATEKAGATTYTCAEGYTVNGTKCVKSYTATYKEGATSYTCPNGGELNGKECTITKDATADVSYTCPSGYTKNGSSCYKVYDATANNTYTCPNGYTQSGNKCIKTTDATANVSYTCPSGYTQSGTKCTKTTTDIKDATAKNTYTCPNGGELNGSKCVTSSSYNATKSTSYGAWVAKGTVYYTSANKAGVSSDNLSKLEYLGAISGATCGSPCGNKGIWYRYNYYTRTASTKYTCPKGGTLSGTKCVTSSSYNATKKTTYTCSSGYTLNGTKCVKSVTDTKTATKNTKYTCSSGTLNGTKCVITTNATVKTNYSCPNGGELNGSKCTITATATKNTKYTCPNGGELNGSKCIKKYDATAKVGTGAYSCPDGGSLNGKTCTITKDATAKTGESTMTCPTDYKYNETSKKCELSIAATKEDVYSYTCPETFTAEGEGEKTVCYKVVKSPNIYYCEDSDATLNGTKCTKVVKGDVTGYTCPTGYTLNGTKCTKNSIETIDATVSTKTTTSYKYTWSKESYLEGWTFTGKTKKVVQNYNAGQR